MDDGALKGRPKHGRFGRPFRALTTNGGQPRALPCSLPISPCQYEFVLLMSEGGVLADRFPLIFQAISLRFSRSRPS
jgi:hypothetical protein